MMQNEPIKAKEVKRSVIAEVLLQNTKGKLLNQYLKIKKIAEGPYSKIKLMKDINTNIFYAMKKYNLFILKKKNKLLKKQKGVPIYTTVAKEVLQEAQILKIVRHQYIAQLVDILQDHQEEKLYLFLEYCQAGEIANWSSKDEIFTLNHKINSVKELTRCFLQISEALHYLHSNDIVHRDIKPQNILLNDKLDVKIIDFGRAVKLQTKEQRLRGSEGTYHFMAPEMLSQVFKEGYDGRQCDMWSLGVTMYAILFGILPFYDQLLIKLFEQIEKGQYEFPQKHNKEYDIFIPIIKKLLSVNPQHRLKAQDLIKQFQKML